MSKYAGSSPRTGNACYILVQPVTLLSGESKTDLRTSPYDVLHGGGPLRAYQEIALPLIEISAKALTEVVER
jgi:hypothetical protein